MKFIATEPDIFAYGESLVFRSQGDMCIPGYNAIAHKAKQEGIRRGIVVYYRKKHNQIITKARSSKKFDIIWLRMGTSIDEILICFFCAPGVNHEEDRREEF